MASVGRLLFLHFGSGCLGIAKLYCDSNNSHRLKVSSEHVWKHSRVANLGDCSNVRLMNASVSLSYTTQLLPSVPSSRCWTHAVLRKSAKRAQQSTAANPCAGGFKVTSYKLLRAVKRR
jgi:hypothetical protein